LRILAVHNFYKEPGGEDQVFAGEVSLLKQHGHFVSSFTLHNDSINSHNLFRVGSATLWNRRESARLYNSICETQADVVHFHNTFPLLSPAAYYAAWRARVPCVQTLHNYRLICPNAILYRDGHVCEDCLGKAIPWPGAFHSCYRGSTMASALTGAMLTAHRVAGTWRKKVTVYISLTDFARKKYIEGGLPADRILVKPNFLNDDPGPGEGGNGALFVGRLTESKGIRVLLQAWRLLAGLLPLLIIGDGPLAGEVAEATKCIPGVQWLGRQPKEVVFTYMCASSALVMPSVWYEAFPMTVVEAFATGLPVVASNLGSLATLIQDRRTGLHFAPGDAADLAAKMRWAVTHWDALNRMRLDARGEFESHYTAERNYSALMGIYDRVLDQAKERNCKSERGGAWHTPQSVHRRTPCRE
jgi:glycosyltransferase involved in cell wall biosynthesis